MVYLRCSGGCYTRPGLSSESAHFEEDATSHNTPFTFRAEATFAAFSRHLHKSKSWVVSLLSVGSRGDGYSHQEFLNSPDMISETAGHGRRSWQPAARGIIEDLLA